MKHLLFLLPLLLASCGAMAKFEQAMDDGALVLKQVREGSEQAQLYLGQAKDLLANIKAMAPQLKAEIDTNKDDKVDFKEILLYLLSGGGVLAGGGWAALAKLKNRESGKRGVIHDRINKMEAIMAKNGG